MPFLRKSAATKKKKRREREEMSQALSADPSALCKLEQRDCFPLISFGKLSGEGVGRGRSREGVRVGQQGGKGRG